MLATRATNGHGHIAAVVACHGGQPVFQEGGNVLLHHVHFGLLLQKIGHRRIQPGEIAQIVFVVRVGQHAHVEHVVGIHRYAVLEGERLEHQRQPAFVGADQVLDVGLQL